MKKRIVIIGGVAAGAGAATKARRTNEASEIIIYEQGEYVSFANCGLPYYVGEVIPQREDLFLITPERFKRRFNIDVKIKHRVTDIDPVKKEVTVEDLTGGTRFQQPYDELVIATGGEPVRPPLPGVELDNIFTLWTVPDADAVKGYIDRERPRRAVVIGGGFIGLEMVENLLQRGIEVTLVEKANQVLPPLDWDMALLIEKHLVEKGVDVILEDGVKAFNGSGQLEQVELESGKRIDADLAILSIGVRPRLELAEKAGVLIGDSGGIVVNSRMQTSVPHIYAAGDIVEKRHLVSGRKVRIPLAGPANKEARVAGANAAGGYMEFRGVLGTAIVKVCDLTVAVTGLNERDAKDAGFDYFVSYTHSQDHAGYYPGAETMTIKVLVDKRTARLIGAQIVGPRGVDKRIDVFATAIYSQLTVEDLEHLDLAYAPPFGSAKDPAIIAGFVAANIYRGEYEAITPEELLKVVNSGEDVQLVDVRSPEEYDGGHIPGAVNIPLDQLRDRLDELDKGKTVYTYCAIGYRSYQACKLLDHHGFKPINLSGGYLHFSRRLPKE
ncbi:MAG: FAD-dependent oxidoreductase [Thermoanaerobacteraceae bacterium]|nr:FAD-dependent oxidoreductase [Thermoanaerobacteraceae bacterium]